MISTIDESVELAHQKSLSCNNQKTTTTTTTTTSNATVLHCDYCNSLFANGSPTIHVIRVIKHIISNVNNNNTH